jgi:hypothetical protein
MPIMTDKITFKELAIKPPVTLRLQFPRSALVEAKGKLGSTVDTTTVDNVRWGAVISVCKEGEPDCATPIKALSVYLMSDRANSRWIVDVYFEEYYVTPRARITYELFKFGAEVDTTIDITFRDSVVSVIANNRELVTTDTMKKFEQIREIGADNAYVDPTGADIAVIDPPPYNLTIIQVADVTGVVSAILPIVITVAVLGVVIGLLVRIFRAPAITPSPAK